MRTTVNLDDSLLEEASKLARVDNRTELLKMALEALIAREASQRLMLLEGKQASYRTATRRKRTAR